MSSDFVNSVLPDSVKSKIVSFLPDSVTEKMNLPSNQYHSDHFQTAPPPYTPSEGKPTLVDHMNNLADKLHAFTSGSTGGDPYAQKPSLADRINGWTDKINSWADQHSGVHSFEEPPTAYQHHQYDQPYHEAYGHQPYGQQPHGPESEPAFDHSEPFHPGFQSAEPPAYETHTEHVPPCDDKTQHAETPLTEHSYGDELTSNPLNRIREGTTQAEHKDAQGNVSHSWEVRPDAMTAADENGVGGKEKPAGTKFHSITEDGKLKFVEDPDAGGVKKGRYASMSDDEKKQAQDGLDKWSSENHYKPIRI